MSRYILGQSIQIDLYKLIEIYLNWKSNPQLFSIYCIDSKCIEHSLNILKHFSIFPRILSINDHQQIIDIYMHMMITTKQLKENNSIDLHYRIMDRIYGLHQHMVFSCDDLIKYNLCDLPIDTVINCKMNIDNIYKYHNIDANLFKIDQFIVDPIIIHVHSNKMIPVSNIIISEQHMLNNRNVFNLTNGRTIKISNISDGRYMGIWKKRKKKRRYKIDSLILEESIIVNHNNTKYAIPIKSNDYQYIGLMEKIYKIVDNHLIKLF